MNMYKSSKASMPFEIGLVKLFFAVVRIFLVLMVIAFAIAKASA